MNSLKDLSKLLDEKTRELSPTEARLAGHLVEHPEKWGFASSSKLAAELGVHRSSLVRFAQRLGFSGYPELQVAVGEAFLESRSHGRNLELTASGAGRDGTLTDLFQRELQNLHQTYENLSLPVLEETAHGIVAARRVLVFGRRFSYPIALHVALSLRTMRDQVRLAPEPGGSSIDVLFDLSEEDFALIVSLRRHSPEVQRTLALLREGNVPHTLLSDASPAGDMPAETRLIRAHTGSTNVLESYTALTSIAHALLTLTHSLTPGATDRLAQVERTWAWFNKR